MPETHGPAGVNRSRSIPGKILLVDDDPSILTVLAWLLKDLGLKVTTALGGREGFNSLCKQRFDMLITDFLMGDQNGLFLVKIANLLYPEMKIIVMTGSPHLLPWPLPSFCRFHVLLEKPFQPDELKDLITNMMGESGPAKGEKDELPKPRVAAKILAPA